MGLLMDHRLEQPSSQRLGGIGLGIPLQKGMLQRGGLEMKSLLGWDDQPDFHKARSDIDDAENVLTIQDVASRVEIPEGEGTRPRLVCLGSPRIR
jgi:hypothetical protein